MFEEEFGLLTVFILFADFFVLATVSLFFTVPDREEKWLVRDCGLEVRSTCFETGAAVLGQQYRSEL